METKKVKMIRDEDMKSVEDIKKFIQKIELERTNGKNIDWEKIGWIELLDRLVENLKIAPQSYRDASREDIEHYFYTAVCPKCGWFGPSHLLLGGAQTDDSGDYGDVFCPVCGNTDIDEK